MMYIFRINDDIVVSKTLEPLYLTQLYTEDMVKSLFSLISSRIIQVPSVRIGQIPSLIKKS